MPRRKRKADPLLPLWEKAAAGDTEALNMLAKAVEPWTRKKSGEYENRFKNEISIDEFFSIGFAKFLPSVKSHTPGKGTFLNYYASNAARAMVFYYKESKKKKVIGQQNVTKRMGETIGVNTTADVHFEAVVCARALSWLTPMERAYISYSTGMRSSKKPPTVEISTRKLSNMLSVPIETAKEIHDDLMAKLKTYAEKGRGGRQRDPVTTAIVQLSIRRREQGRLWKEIIREVRVTYGRQYTLEGLARMANRVIYS